MTGKTAVAGDFQDLHAAHVFPQARELEWNAAGYSNWITDNNPTDLIGANKIYSPQNGLLLYTGVHSLFDIYALAVNPNVRSNTSLISCLSVLF